MRRILLVLIAFTIIASASKSLASTDCEKWLAEYKQELAHKASVQRALAAKERARNYAKRKVGLLIAPAVAPKPHPVRVSSTRPRLTPAQMLKRFDLMCGDMPVEPTNQVLDERMSPDEFVSEMAMGGPVDTDALPPSDELIASEDAPPYTPATVTQSGGDNGQPFWPVYGPVPTGFGSGGTPTPPPVIPPVSPIPEPSSLVLMATGLMGAAGSAVRRRFAA